MWEDVSAPPRIELDSRDFRRALGAFPTGVCLVTTCDCDGHPAGLTVNSFSSVSLDPPMILWSLARSASCARAFCDSDHFAVNVLGTEDRELASHFASFRGDKFAAYADCFEPSIEGVPLLRGAAAVFECRCRYRNYGGDHLILIGAVERYTWSGEREPLVFYRGAFARLAR